MKRIRRNRPRIDEYRDARVASVHLGRAPRIGHEESGLDLILNEIVSRISMAGTEPDVDQTAALIQVQRQATDTRRQRVTAAPPSLIP